MKIIFLLAVILSVSSFLVNGQDIKTVVIGEKTWMAKNVNDKVSGSWCYDNKSDNCEKYGRLYTWDIAINICPNDWHLPSDQEWKELETSLGLSQETLDNDGFRGTNQGSQLMPGGTSKFNALYGGYRPWIGNFFNINEQSFFWTSSEGKIKNHAIFRSLYDNQKKINRGHIDKTNALSVRCIKD